MYVILAKYPFSEGLETLGHSDLRMAEEHVFGHQKKELFSRAAAIKGSPLGFVYAYPEDEAKAIRAFFRDNYPESSVEILLLEEAAV